MYIVIYIVIYISTIYRSICRSISLCICISNTHRYLSISVDIALYYCDCEVTRLASHSLRNRIMTSG